MKNSALLFVVLFLVFSKTCWGQGNSQINNFNAYINSSGGSVESLVNKDIAPMPVDDKTKENLVKAEPLLPGIPAQWQVCSIDSDCTAVVADCVSWEPLNKKYLTKLSKNLNFCSTSIDPGFQPKTVCVKKACKATDKTTLVSWQEWLSEMRKRREGKASSKEGL